LKQFSTCKLANSDDVLWSVS